MQRIYIIKVCLVSLLPTKHIPPVTQSNLLRLYMRLYPFLLWNLTGFQYLRIITQFSLNTAYTSSLSVSLTWSSNSLHSCSSYSKQNTVLPQTCTFILLWSHMLKFIWSQISTKMFNIISWITNLMRSTILYVLFTTVFLVPNKYVFN